MNAFEFVKQASGEEDALQKLMHSVSICMKQYHPTIKTIEDVEDSFDMSTVYKILDIAAGIKMNSDKQESISNEANSSGASWDELDLAKLESEVFLLGNWRDYEELESCLSMPELTAVLNAKREDDYNHKKFLAAIQGVDLDKEAGRSKNAWEDMKARVFSRGKTKDANDIVSMQGVNAQKAGFGIGMGLDYEDLG